MQSIGHAVRMAEALHKGLHGEKARDGGKPVSAQQRAESAKIYKQVSCTNPMAFDSAG